MVRLPDSREEGFVALAAVHDRRAGPPLEDLVKTRGQLRRDRRTHHLRGQASEIADRNRLGDHANGCRSTYRENRRQAVKQAECVGSLTVALRELVLDRLHERLARRTPPDLTDELLVLVVGAVTDTRPKGLPELRSLG